ncbi:hypothetical protein D3C81_07830 [compost metagenome]
MSFAGGQVRFEDGVIKYFQYDGTSDFCIPNLYDTHKELMANWNKDKTQECNHVSSDERVEIYSDYADGAHWYGTACRKCNLLINGLDPLNLKSEEYEIPFYTSGKPYWVE